MVWCGCGAVGVDGGTDYMKISADHPNHVKVLTDEEDDRLPDGTVICPK